MTVHLYLIEPVNKSPQFDDLPISILNPKIEVLDTNEGTLVGKFSSLREVYSHIKNYVENDKKGALKYVPQSMGNNKTELIQVEYVSNNDERIKRLDYNMIIERD